MPEVPRDREPNERSPSYPRQLSLENQVRTVAHSAVTKDGVTAFTKVLGTEKRGKGGTQT